MHYQAVRRLTIESELRRGVARGEFCTHFQPIMCLDTGQMVAAEALVRWQHPQRGLVFPAEFIGIAEESGFINILGLIILEASCRQLQEWKTRTPGLDLSVSVNISANQLTNRDFCSNVEAILRSTGLDPKSLILEITETVLMDITDLTRRTLREIRDKGIRVYLDDFGTGYSSLSLLHTFQLDGLKIDRSFVKEAGRLLQYAAIIQAINDLSHKLGMQVKHRSS
jgi:EAL domain-containing protein (putative c-di-GMP-specific phosphodiesterase class I)